MKRKRYLWLFLAILFSMVITSPIVGRADFGDYAGDSDYGDSGYSDSYDSDYSWSDSDDDDYDYQSSSSGDSASMSDFGFAFVIFVVVMAYIMLKDSIDTRRRKKKRAAKNKKNQGTTRSAGGSGRYKANQPRGKDISTYVEVDPNFDQTAFEEKLSNLYVQMQNGWTDKNIKSLQPYFSDAIFKQMERQLQQKIKAGQTNYVERIAVLSVTPQTWYQENDFDHIVVRLETRIVDYTLDDATGELISGSKSKEKFMTYEWDLSRKTGVTTEKTEGPKTIHCPNCGAPLDINASTICPFCRSVVKTEQEDWVITRIQGLAQRTGR